jgi:hypothetical protein
VQISNVQMILRKLLFHHFLHIRKHLVALLAASRKASMFLAAQAFFLGLSIDFFKSGFGHVLNNWVGRATQIFSSSAHLHI